MKRFSFLILFLIPLILFSQEDTSSKGIKWTTGLSWEEMKQKAKAENKYIFVDCFATWCVPCKAMDKDVYTNDTVAQLVNEKFISVKVQMDKTENDPAFIKKWYYTASGIKSHYNVNAFPTFLFFSPDGIPLHKGVGYKSTGQFISLVHDMFSPDKQYYSVLRSFKPGTMDTADMKGLARSFINSDKVLAGRIAVDYLSRIDSSELTTSDNLQFMLGFNDNSQVQEIVTKYLKSKTDREFNAASSLQLINSFKKVPAVINLAMVYLANLGFEEISLKSNLNMLKIFNDNSKAKEIADRYINRLPERKIYTKEHIQLLTAFTKASNDRGFYIFYNKGRKVNSIMNLKQSESKNVAVLTTDYAGIMADYIITKEEIDPFWDKAKSDIEINWKVVHKSIKLKYNLKVADRVVLNSKVNFYKYYAENFNKHWSSYVKYNIEKIEKYGTDTTSGFSDAIELNNFAYGAVFLHCNEDIYIKKGIKWMEGVVRRRPGNANNIDTYANLLYKAGHTNHALEWENKALQMAIKRKDDSSIRHYQSIISKMQEGKPTW